MITEWSTDICSHDVLGKKILSTKRLGDNCDSFRIWSYSSGEYPSSVDVDGCEILNQLIGGKHPIVYRVSTILLVMQDFFHPQYVEMFIIKSNLMPTFQVSQASQVTNVASQGASKAGWLGDDLRSSLETMLMATDIIRSTEPPSSGFSLPRLRAPPNQCFGKSPPTCTLASTTSAQVRTVAFNRPQRQVLQVLCIAHCRDCSWYIKKKVLSPSKIILP